MELPTNLTTPEDRDSFLKTRTDSLDLSDEIINILLENKIITVRSLINKSDVDLKRLGLKQSQIDIILNSFTTLSLYLNFQTQKRKATRYINGETDPEQEKEICNFISKKVNSAEGEDIIDSFAKHFGINKDDLIGPSRKKEIVQMRDIVVYVLRKYGDLSFPAIAKILGNRDHTTAIHSFRKMEKNIVLHKNFETEFFNLITESKDIKDEIEQSLVEDTLLSFEEKYKNNTYKVINISERNLNIRELYRQGISLDNIGKEYNITRERVRQIVLRTIKQQTFNESISSGVKIDFDTQFNEEKKVRHALMLSKRPTKAKKKLVRMYKWSLYHESCKSCGTETVRHFKNGLCEDCGNKSITGDVREKMIRDHGGKCDLCNLSRSQVIENYNRDFYLSRKMQSVLCKKCFLVTTGNTLASSKKNRWRMFYN